MQDQVLDDRGSPKRRRRFGCWPIGLVVLATTIVAATAAWNYFEYRFRLQLIPEDLGAWWISDVEQESWGFGPGGNETGVIVYVLPEAAAQAIAMRGVAYLNELDSGRRRPRDRHNMFGEWRPTPVISGELSEHKDLASYLDRYGFGIDVGAGLERYVNTIMSSPGSFYADGRIGVVIIDPTERKIVFLHSG